MASERNVSSVTETTQQTRQPTPLAVLLASAGTPPLDPEQARLAPVRLYDAFVLSPDRVQLFTGHARSLFAARRDVLDPRHDAMARLIRAVATTLRQRLETYESTNAGRDLLRGISALAPANIEGLLTGFDLRRATGTVYTSELMLGSLEPEVDPLDAPDAGVLRRLLALAARGLMVEKSSRTGGIVSDLGGVTLVLALLDLLANPRSALRAARVRLTKSGKLRPDDTARVRDVGQALRELIHHAVASATTTGAAGRDLLKESTLSPELMDHLAVALARAVHDGLGPDEEHPLVVPGADASDALTFVPLLTPSNDPPTLGLYNRIAFLPLPYARVITEPSTEPPRPPRSLPLDESAFNRAREALRPGNQNYNLSRAIASTSAILETIIDPADPDHVWHRGTAGSVPSALTRAIEQQGPATHMVILVGSRSATAREALQTFATWLSSQARWHVLAPRPATHTLTFEPLPTNTSHASLALRRADLSRHLDRNAPQTIEWNIEPGAWIVINAIALDTPSNEAIETLLAIVTDTAHKADPRTLLLLAGAANHAEAARLLAAVVHHPEMETTPVPLRTSSICLIRTDGPLCSRSAPSRGSDETILATLAETLVPVPALADLAARALLIPPEAKYKGRLVRLAALGSPNTLTEARRAAERAMDHPWDGVAMRRALQLGVGSLNTSRAALSAGLVVELLGCLRHEIMVVLAEYEGQRARTHASRLADVARGQLVELVMAAHPRATVLASDTLANALADKGAELIDRVTVMDELHATALGARAGGTVYAREEPKGAVPLGFVLRGGVADLYTLVDITVGSLPTRPVPAPHLVLTWQATPSPDRERTLGTVAALLAALHEAARRWGMDAPARIALRDGRPTYGAMMDISLDARWVPEAVRMFLPLRTGTNETEVERIAADTVARLSEVTAGPVLSEWSAQCVLEGRPAAPIALAGPLLSRELLARWTRALRLLPRYFPTRERNDGRYARAPAIASAAELGLAAAVLAERRTPPSSPEGRALLSRIANAASELMPRVRELTANMPVHPSFQQGSDWEVLERCLSIAWFLHVNFCTSAEGPLQWAPADGPAIRSVVGQYLDWGALKVWLQRKTTRPASVEERIQSMFQTIEPSVVIEE